MHGTSRRSTCSMRVRTIEAGERDIDALVLEAIGEAHDLALRAADADVVEHEHRIRVGHGDVLRVALGFRQCSDGSFRQGRNGHGTVPPSAAPTAHAQRFTFQQIEIARSRGAGEFARREIARAPADVFAIDVDIEQPADRLRACRRWRSRRTPSCRRRISPSGSKKLTTGTPRIHACRKVLGNPSMLEVLRKIRARSNHCARIGVADGAGHRHIGQLRRRRLHVVEIGATRRRMAWLRPPA